MIETIARAGIDPPNKKPIDGVDLLPRVPEAWYGQSIDVRRLPTPWGALAYAVRWHGARPALLWELDPWDAATSCALTCSGLDPAWTTVEASGEALLAEPPGDAGS